MITNKHYIKTAELSSCKRFMHGELVAMIDDWFCSFEYHYDIEEVCLFITNSDDTDNDICKDLARLCKYVYDNGLYKSN